MGRKILVANLPHSIRKEGVFTKFLLKFLGMLTRGDHELGGGWREGICLWRHFQAFLSTSSVNKQILRLHDCFCKPKLCS